MENRRKNENGSGGKKGKERLRLWKTTEEKKGVCGGEGA